MFFQGNVVILESCASGKSLIMRISDVQDTGGRSQFTQFRVHVRHPGVVALQNFHTPENWLAIFQGKTVGTVCTVYIGHDISFVLCRDVRR